MNHPQRVALFFPCENYSNELESVVASISIHVLIKRVESDRVPLKYLYIFYLPPAYGTIYPDERRCRSVILTPPILPQRISPHLFLPPLDDLTRFFSKREKKNEVAGMMNGNFWNSLVVVHHRNSWAFLHPPSLREFRSIVDPSHDLGSHLS